MDRRGFLKLIAAFTGVPAAVGVVMPAQGLKATGVGSTEPSRSYNARLDELTQKAWEGDLVNYGTKDCVFQKATKKLIRRFKAVR